MIWYSRYSRMLTLWGTNLKEDILHAFLFPNGKVCRICWLRGLQSPKPQKVKWYLFVQLRRTIAAAGRGSLGDPIPNVSSTKPASGNPLQVKVMEHDNISRNTHTQNDFLVVWNMWNLVTLEKGWKRDIFPMWQTWFLQVGLEPPSR